jgi:peptidyl-dipeptidase Dcp
MRMERDTELDGAAAALLAQWTGRCSGVPPFDEAGLHAFEPALEAAMQEQLLEVDTIVEGSHPPTFHNTVEALERTGRSFDRAAAVYHVWRANMSTPEFREIERAMAPRLAAFADRITQNEALFRRIEVAYKSPEKERLTAEQQRLVWLHYTNFVRSGARLPPAGKARLSEINQRLAALFTEFNQNVLADEDGAFLLLESESDLDGLPQSLRDAAASAAAERGHGGKWLISNTRSSMEPFLVHAARRDLRERGWRLWTSRGEGGADHDNAPVISEILALRAERAKLLGYETHAHWRLEHTMAGTPERVLQLLETVWPHAVARVEHEVRNMEALARAEGADIRIEPWDYRHYAEKVRRRDFDIDQETVQQYLTLDNVREAMFWVAGELFDLVFTPVDDVPVFHPDVRVWAVSRRSDTAELGLWYFDPFARQGKKSGAWMTAYRSQENLDGAVPALVSNNCNYVKPRAGEPVLISWDDATTLFHEFGHALHGLLSDVTYPSLSGTAVPRDFVEFPSQLLEHWLITGPVLQRFARHWRTGEVMPEELVRKLERAATFNQGFATTEYLASAFIDMRLHLADPDDIDPRTFEQQVLHELGMPAQLVMRHRTPHFQHVFGSDGYSAGYYSYLWADTLVADAFEAFTQAGGAYDASTAERLRTEVLAAGNTRDPAEAYRSFRGRDATTDALMRKRGFAAAGSA